MQKRATAATIVPTPFRTVRPSAGEREEKRRAVLAAAVGMFNERGYHATSLDDVAASLQVTKPVIYHYLGNKEAVLLECVRIGLAELREAVAASALGTGTGLDRLIGFLIRYGEIIMGDFGRCVIRTGDELLSAAAVADVRAGKRQVHDAMRAMIDGAVADGSASVADAPATALVLAGALNWTARWFRPDGPETAQGMARRLVDALARGLVPALVPAS